MSEGSLEVVLHLVRAVELAFCLAVAVVLTRRYRARATPATASALGLFAMLCFVLVVGWWEPSDPDGLLARLLSDLGICALLSIPLLFVHLAHVLGGVSRTVLRANVGAYAVVAVVTLAAPRLPEDGEPVADWVVPYLALVLGVWTVQSAIGAWALWRIGREQSSVVRRRMRMLSTGAVFVALTIIVAGVTVGSSPDAVAVLTSLLGLCAVLQFAVAFLAPPSLRAVWRQEDVAALSSAERGLMTALTREQVAHGIVPALGAVFAGGAGLFDVERDPVLTYRLSEQQVEDVRSGLAEWQESAPTDGHHERVQDLGDGTLAARLAQGWLVVHAGRLAPVFGNDEAVLLARVSTLVDLALQRVELHERERVSRVAAEAATHELETLLYSVSHDLRSPLISVLGYLDVLTKEHGQALQGDGAHYLERITVNAVYMQSLIADLLELSRIGRVDQPADVVDLHGLAQQVVEAARLSATEATIRVDGTLPHVVMNDVRARQLLTNLVDNALKHGGRPDLTVTVRGGVGDEGALVLEVADDGRGIPAEYRSRVLQVFERLDAPKSSSGTGMGLAICKRIVESLGGTLEVTGPDSGSGTIVRMHLPARLLATQVPAPAAPLDERAHGASTTKETV